jgi:glycosyltransferase involved in cell wall biosynthesis
MAYQQMRVLVLCDSPVVRPEWTTTGFARVATNILYQWTKLGMDIEIWGIHFDGWNYQDVPWKLYPGSNHDWNSAANLNAFLNKLASGKYTHVWLLNNMDCFAVGQGEKSFGWQLDKICAKHDIRSMIYFPIDTPFQKAKLTDVLHYVDESATFTDFGREAITKYLTPDISVAVIPHGLDNHFKPASEEIRRTVRSYIAMADGRMFAGPEDFLILNLNKNEGRKDFLRSLEILAKLKGSSMVPVKMILRTGQVGLGRGDGIAIHDVAEQLGLEDGVDYCVMDSQPEAFMPSLYQAADLYLTTTLGEGWGLGITEAMGCGVAVAVPDNSSCGEIARAAMFEQPQINSQILILESESGYVCGADGRLRKRVDLQGAVDQLLDFINSPRGTDTAREYYRETLSETAHKLWSWERTAKQMAELLRGGAL